MSQFIPSTPVKLNKPPPPSSVESFFAAGIVNAKDLASQKGSTAAAKEPLSLQTTSANFKRFVQKSGPIFAAQDAAEAVIRWEDAPRTLFFGAAWAFLCIYPRFIVVLPNMIIVSILLTTYTTNPHSPALGSAQDRDAVLPSAAPPAEGSVDYLANLRNIQIMMGHIADLSDLGRSLVPFLAWHDFSTSLVLLQLTCLSGLALAFLSPFIPWRAVLLFGGEALLFGGHPIVQSFLAQAMPYITAQRTQLIARLGKLVRDDALSDDDLERPIRAVEKFELERWVEGGAAWVPESWFGGDLPRGHQWIVAEDWEVDSEGWVYLSIDGRRATSGEATEDRPAALSRRRRWTRRAVNVAVELS